MIQEMQWPKYHFMLASPTGFFCAFGFSTLDAAYVKSRLCNYVRWWSDGLNSVNRLPQNIAHLDHSVEEGSPSLNTPAGNALTHNNLFIHFPDSVNPHGQCQKLSDEFLNFPQNTSYEPRLFSQQCEWSSCICGFYYALYSSSDIQDCMYDLSVFVCWNILCAEQ